MANRLSVKKNDTVIVLAGKDKGNQGKILRVFPKTNRVLVEGINRVKRHLRPTQNNPHGGIQEKDLPLHRSNVMIVCPNCNQPARISKTFLEDGKKVRSCKKCSEAIDKK